MYRYVKPYLLLILVILFTSCNSGPKFSDKVMNRDWSLVEARILPNDVIYNSNEFSIEGVDEIYTLRFDGERVSGVAMPNRYFGPYELLEKQAISIKQMASTLMISFLEPERLGEHDYFTVLKNTYKWDIVGGNLALYSKNEAGAEVVLIYALVEN